jgi:7-keto-8-aminopelargonate synthetase-like enzyme
MQATKSPGRTIEVNGSAYLYFGGTAYLGLQSHPLFQSIVQEHLLRWGTSWGSSRLSNVTLSAYEAAETYLTQLTGAPAVCTVSSGMTAGRLAVETLRPLTRRFFHMPVLHPAIQVPDSLPVFSGEGKLNSILLSENEEDITILVDAVPSFAVQPTDLGFLASLPLQKKITLLMDESHSLGLCGTNGVGISFNVNLPNVVRKIMVASLGKALGVAGGMIASDEDFLNLMIKEPIFIGGAGMVPALAQTLADAGEVVKEQQRKLQDNLDYFFPRIQSSAKLSFHPQYPVIYPTHTGLYEYLFNRGILITHFQYATAEETLSRVVISAHHTFKDLDRLANCLMEWENNI